LNEIFLNTLQPCVLPSFTFPRHFSPITPPPPPPLSLSAPSLTCAGHTVTITQQKRGMKKANKPLELAEKRDYPSARALLRAPVTDSSISPSHWAAAHSANRWRGGGDQSSPETNGCWCFYFVNDSL